MTDTKWYVSVNIFCPEKVEVRKWSQLKKTVYQFQLLRHRNKFLCLKKPSSLPATELIPSHFPIVPF